MIKILDKYDIVYKVKNIKANDFFIGLGNCDD
jgi:hypothetical protein